MHANVERCLPHLRTFASSLGWPDLVAHHENVDGLDIIHYTSGILAGRERELFLQINELPIGNTDQFAGAVYAIPYSLFTGWLQFDFPNTATAITEAIKRVDHRLNKKWFTNDEFRIEFSKRFPACTGWDWKRLQTSPEDYP